jgi:hypothetical protein
MKTERIYLRTTPEDKKFLQEIADTKYEGNLSALFDDLIKKLKEQEGEE